MTKFNSEFWKKMGAEMLVLHFVLPDRIEISIEFLLDIFRHCPNLESFEFRGKFRDLIFASGKVPDSDENQSNCHGQIAFGIPIIFMLMFIHLGKKKSCPRISLCSTFPEFPELTKSYRPSEFFLLLMSKKFSSKSSVAHVGNRFLRNFRGYLFGTSGRKNLCQGTSADSPQHAAIKSQRVPCDRVSLA